MANRRMFSKIITSSSSFLMMPHSSQCLYFQLGMNADDDGFCEHFAIMRMTDSKPDDLKILQAKNFVKVFDDKVLVVVDWKENNYLRSDRYTPSKYLEIYKKELKLLSKIAKTLDTIGIPDDIPQVDVGKDRIGKVRKEIGEVTEDPQEIPKIIKEMEKIDPKNKDYYGNPTQRNACAFLLKEYGLEETINFIDFLSKNMTKIFNPPTTPLMLKNNWVRLISEVGYQINKNKSKQRIVN